jgi:hypothetical protein
MYRWSRYLPNRDRSRSIIRPQRGRIRIQSNHSEAILRLSARYRPLGNPTRLGDLFTGSNPFLPPPTHFPSLLLPHPLYLLHCDCHWRLGSRISTTCRMDLRCWCRGKALVSVLHTFQLRKDELGSILGCYAYSACVGVLRYPPRPPQCKS